MASAKSGADARRPAHRRNIGSGGRGSSAGRREAAREEWVQGPADKGRCAPDIGGSGEGMNPLPEGEGMSIYDSSGVFFLHQRKQEYYRVELSNNIHAL